MARRLVTALILLLVAALALFAPPPWVWPGFVTLATGIAAREWGALTGMPTPVAWAYALLTPLAGVLLPESLWPGVALLGLLFWLFIAPLWLSRRWQPERPLLLATAGWAVLLPAFVALVGLHAQGAWSLLALMAVVWLADSAAYFTGRRFGRMKLAPAISPGKTREGVIGALIAVSAYALLCVLFGAPVAVLPLFLVMAVLSVEGDLFESWIKRTAGVKDSGRLLPGHGGVLDRIDGLVAALPAAWWFIAGMATPT